MINIETIPHFRGFFRESTRRTALDSGSARLEFSPVRQGYVWRVDLVSVAGPSISGAVANIYRNMVADETYMGSIDVAANAPGGVFTDATLTLHSGERLIVDLADSTGDDAIATVEYRVYELEEREWEHRPVNEPAARVAVLLED